MLRGLSITFVWLVSVCGLAFAGVVLWVLASFPGEPRRSDTDILGLQVEARKGESPGRIDPLKAGEASRQRVGGEPGARGGVRADVTRPSISFRASDCTYQRPNGPRRPCESGSSSADAAKQEKATKDGQTEAGPGAGTDQPQLVRTETQDRQLAISGTLTDSRPPMQCNVDLCTATYKSFKAADCTYQPYGGGPRSFCELSTQSADGSPQTLRAATNPRFEVKDTPVAETAAEVPKSATPARAGQLCNVNLCAATYASFHAADCTYQPHGGGLRRICER